MSAVVELKYGIPPEVVVPDTVIGNTNDAEAQLAQSAAEEDVATMQFPVVAAPLKVTLFKMFALIVPVPDIVRDPPVPITRAFVFVAALIPENGAAVAVIVPEPLVVREPPVPTSKAAVLVPEVMDAKDTLPAPLFGRQSALH